MQQIFALVATLLIFIGAASGIAGDTYNYGKGWQNTSEPARVYWVWGFAQGQESMLEELQVKSKENLKYLISDREADTISKIMTMYYEDAANSYIPWKYMTFIARMKLEGKSSSEIEKQLELLRQYTDYLKKAK